MSNIEIIKKEFEEHKGQFVISESGKVERFVGIVQDDQDYYYVLYDGRKINWQSCVGRLVWLKGKIEDKDYEYFINIAKLNHNDQLGTENYIEDLMKLNSKKDSYISSYYFDLQ